MSRHAITVLVADGHPEILHVVSYVLSQHFNVLRSVSSGDSLITAALELEPDVVVSDLHMEAVDGVEAMLQLKALGLKAAFVLMGVSQRDTEFLLEKGASGYVHKYDICADLVNAILCARAGHTFVSRSTYIGALMPVARIEPLCDQHHSRMTQPRSGGGRKTCISWCCEERGCTRIYYCSIGYFDLIDGHFVSASRGKVACVQDDAAMYLSSSLGENQHWRCPSCGRLSLHHQ